MVLVLYDYEILIEMTSEIVSVRSPSHAVSVILFTKIGVHLLTSNIKHTNFSALWFTVI